MNKKGIIYILTTAVSGIIKIGMTQTKQFEERMRFLESNGYYNIVGLKRFFAIEVSDYTEKEKLLHEVFEKHRVGNSELFNLDHELVKQLLLSFEGDAIYPKNIDKEKAFDQVVKTRKDSARFNFYDIGLKNGDEIVFAKDEKEIAVIVGEREVEYFGQVYKLSPLVYKLFEKRGELNESGAYQGAAYFKYKGKKLKDIKVTK